MGAGSCGKRVIGKTNAVVPGLGGSQRGVCELGRKLKRVKAVGAGTKMDMAVCVIECV